jgi:RND family efflux transporter MFP subunit
VAELNADMALQNAEFERISSLVAEGALSKQSLDQVIRDRDAAKAALNSARQQVIANEAAIRETEASLDQAAAEVQSVEEDLKDTTVKAPIAGIVADLAVKQGDYVEAGDTLTTITDNRSLEIDLPIPVEYRDRLRSGLAVELRNYATEVVIAKGTIDFISPTVDATTQSILAKAKVQNPDGTLRDSQQVEARIIWSENPGVLVPTEAIVRFGGQTFVFVAKNQEGKTIAEQRVVELGDLQGNAYQIVSGLSAGEAIVISGMLNLADGVTIVSQP